MSKFYNAIKLITKGLTHCCPLPIPIFTNFSSYTEPNQSFNVLCNSKPTSKPSLAFKILKKAKKISILSIKPATKEEKSKLSECPAKPNRQQHKKVSSINGIDPSPTSQPPINTPEVKEVNQNPISNNGLYISLAKQNQPYVCSHEQFTVKVRILDQQAHATGLEEKNSEQCDLELDLSHKGTSKSHFIPQEGCTKSFESPCDIFDEPKETLPLPEEDINYDSSDESDILPFYFTRRGPKIS